MKHIPLVECEFRGVYRVHSRNLALTVYDGKNGFIGIREKFGSLYLFTEYHWEQGAPHGTVHPLEKLGMLPDDIQAEESPGDIDTVTGRSVWWNKDVPNPNATAVGRQGWWAFTDTGETCLPRPGVSVVGVGNDALFKYLQDFEKEKNNT